MPNTLSWRKRWLSLCCVTGLSGGAVQSLAAIAQSLDPAKPVKAPPAGTDLVPLEPGSDRFSSYENALIAMVKLRTDHREEASRVLTALARIQAEDGSVVFSGSIKAPEDGAAHVRSGALAWVGYAAASYLLAVKSVPGETPEAAQKAAAINKMAQKIASYLLAKQINDPRDPRHGLILGGFGSYTNIFRGGEVVEEFVPGPIPWASTEHNIDAYFFFREMHALTAEARYFTAATMIGDALVEKLWNAQNGQFSQGISEHGRDETMALDCASWGALFLVSHGDKQRAAIALETAERRYAVVARGHRGHRPYIAGPLVEPASLAEALHLPAGGNDWGQLQAVWPEGSAGVALAAWRLGDHARAAAILADLDQLRRPDGSLPDLTEKVPFAFGGGPSVAGTAWFELVRLEPQGGIW